MERLPTSVSAEKEIGLVNAPGGELKHFLGRVIRKPVPTYGDEIVERKGSDKIIADPTNKVPGQLAGQLASIDLKSGVPFLPPRPRPSLSLETSFSVDTVSTYLESGEKFDGAVRSASAISTPGTAQSTSSLHKAYREARHLAGGLVYHPSHSTKTFSILRHSHGLIFYQGVTTCVAISIFADAPVPADRTIWLQSKGWTGKTGMRVQALIGQNGWLNVTPMTSVNADQLDPDDERAWQRDISSFFKRAKGDKRSKHKLRETAIVRIPVEAQDGYYRLVLCTGAKKKVLCPSPVFRVLSTSASPGSVRGASLGTLPLEIGAKILTSAAKSTLGNAISPLRSALQQDMKPYEPSWVSRKLASTAYDASGTEKRVNSNLEDANHLYAQKRNASLSPLVNDMNSVDDGPQPPYPIKFVGIVDSYTSNVILDVPTAVLAAVPEEISRRFDGYYFGWAKTYPKKNNEKPTLAENDLQWQQTLISALPLNLAHLDRVKIAHLGVKTFHVSFIQETDEPILIPPNSKIEIRIMGFLRPQDQPTLPPTENPFLEGAEDDESLLDGFQDIEIAQAFLDHSAWAPEAFPQSTQPSKLSPLEKIKASYAELKLNAQRQGDRVPLHRAGVRMPVDRVREEAISSGGIYVIR